MIVYLRSVFTKTNKIGIPAWQNSRNPVYEQDSAKEIKPDKELKDFRAGSKAVKWGWNII